MTFEEFEGLVFGWATDRKIIQNGKPYTQALKLSEEWGEVCRALAKGDKDGLKDGLGDCGTVVINLARMITGGPVDSSELARFMDIGSCVYLPESGVVGFHGCLEKIYALILQIDAGDEGRGEAYSATFLAGRWLSQALCDLYRVAASNGLDFMDCCAHAWDEISDRRGFLNELGVFIKEEKSQ